MAVRRRLMPDVINDFLSFGLSDVLANRMVYGASVAVILQDGETRTTVERHVGNPTDGKLHGAISFGDNLYAAMNHLSKGNRYLPHSLDAVTMVRCGNIVVLVCCADKGLGFNVANDIMRCIGV